MILAIGNSCVYEVSAFNAVFEILKKRGHDAILFKQDKCLEGEFLTFEVKNGQPRYYLAADGKRYDINKFSAIWYLKPHLPKELLNYPIAEYRQLINRQFYAMREAIWTIFQNKRWVNDPWAVQKSENKIFQLQAASKIDFKIPDTIITSDPETVRNFYKNHQENIAVKLLAVSPIPDKVIYTNKVTSEYLEQIESIKMSPAIFQEIIPKSCELRITVVGDKIFPIKIYSQEDKETALDWRRKPLLNDFEVKMEPCELPQLVTKQIRSLMKTLDLRFGCLDMIITPKGEYVFLEINPNGQWYFAQLKTGVKIAEAIADLLVR